MSLLKPLFVSLFLIIGLIGGSAMADSPIVYADRGAALSGYDPVAYFTIGRPVPGKPELTLVWKRAKWRFSSVENMAMFEANPRAYAPQFGGYCAYGVAMGVLSTTKPDVWMIHEGRLYLVHSTAVRQIWSRNLTTHVARAHDNWPSVLND